MRKIIVLEFMSLDGVIQAPGGPEEDSSGGFRFGGWSVPYSDDVVGKVMAEQMKQPFALLLGRNTFDIWASYWPQHADYWPGINEVTKYVVSKTLAAPEWENSVVIKGDVAAELKRLKQESGPNLHVYGSGQLVQTLLEHELVDELWLKTYPVILGKGKRMFGEGSMPRAFTLKNSVVSPKGVVVASYERAGEVETGSF